MAAAANLSEARSHNVTAEVLRTHYKIIRDAQSDHSETGMALARAKKAAKNVGIDLDAMKDLERLSKLDEDEVTTHLRHVSDYADKLQLPFTTQLGMFGRQAETTGGGKPARAPARKAATPRAPKARDLNGSSALPN